MKKDLAHKELTIIRSLTGYYGLLQCLHLLSLARAGFILFFQQGTPFPILPPPEGWHPQTMPFLLGLAVIDLVAIITGILFAYRLVIKKQTPWRLGSLSLIIAATSAVVFGVGTFASGAWAAHPASYWIMVGLFIPVIFLMVVVFNAAPGK